MVNGEAKKPANAAPYNKYYIEIYLCNKNTKKTERSRRGGYKKNKCKADLHFEAVAKERNYLKKCKELKQEKKNENE